LSKLSRLAALMDANPRLAMLGAAIDQRDFVSFDEPRLAGFVCRFDTTRHLGR
jgi:hypothetical protein